MLSGWSAKIGSLFGGGRIPVMIAGTALVVEWLTVVAFRNQVAFRANRAKLGKRSASIFLLRFMSENSGNSSKTIMTTGVRAETSVTAALTSSGMTSFSMGDVSRKSARKTNGDGVRIVRKLLACGTRR